MLARVFSCAVIGLDGVIVEVEVDTSQGLPGMDIVGLPDAAVQESRQRVMAAIKNAGYPYPRKRLTVNLAPGSVRKEGPVYDLPIALGVLACMEIITTDVLNDGLVIGELSLDNSVRHVRGILPMSVIAREKGFKRIFVPQADAAEAALIPEPDEDPLLVGGLVNRFRIRAVEREWLDHEDVLAGLDRRQGMIDVDISRTAYHHAVDGRIVESCGVVVAEFNPVILGEVLRVGDRAGHGPGEAHGVALALDRADQPLAPRPEAYDCQIEHC